MRKVFLSSTGKYLWAHRKAVYKAIEGLDGYHCVRMEDFGARDADAADFCPERVAECDVFVGIVGHCYGSCPEGDERSFTVGEYDAARKADKPRLMFLAPQDFPVPGNLIEPDEKRAAQGKFRDRVSTETIRDTFTSPDDLARRVVAAIRNWEHKQPAARKRQDAEGAPRLMPLPPQPCFVHPYPLQKHFTGRVAERRMLTEWLTSSESPVFAYVAIGGMGKSALTWAWVQRDVLGFALPGATEDEPDVAQACRVPADARPEGVLWWSFYEREARFASFLDHALGYVGGGGIDPSEIPSEHDKVIALADLLAQKRILLVLDGLERELRAYASLNAAYQGDDIAQDERGDFRTCIDPHTGDFLRAAGSVHLAGRVLLTSRLMPRELEGLGGCQHEELKKWHPEDVVVFFHNQGVKGTRAEIQEVCQPYGFHPLSLRLLAGVVKRNRRSPGDIKVARDYPVLDELKGKEQHHILMVAYDELDEEKRELLSRLAAFRNAMSYEALVIFNPYDTEEQFNGALDELSDRGLLFYDPQHEGNDLHPIVRQYAYDRLTDKKGIHGKLRDYFADVPQPEKVERLDDLAPVIELYHHTVRAGRFDDANELLRRRLIPDPLYHQFGSYQTCIELLRGLFPDGEDKPPRLKDPLEQGWTLGALATSYIATGQTRRALPLSESSNAIAECEGDKMNLAIGLATVESDVLQLLGELASSERKLRRAVDVAREFGVDLPEGHTELLRRLAYRGAFREGAKELTTALKSFRKRGHTQGQCVLSAYRAHCGLLMRDATSALEAARHARKLADETAKTTSPVERDFVRAEWLLGWSLVALAGEEGNRRDYSLAQAEGNLTEALTRCRRINNVEHEPDILLAWGRWHRAKGDAQRAKSDAEEALRIADRCEYRLKQAEIHNFLARLALDENDRNTARKHAEIAKERAWCDGPPYCYKPALDEAEAMLKELSSV